VYHHTWPFPFHFKDKKTQTERLSYLFRATQTVTMIASMVFIENLCIRHSRRCLKKHFPQLYPRMSLAFSTEKEKRDSEEWSTWPNSELAEPGFQPGYLNPWDSPHLSSLQQTSLHRTPCRILLLLPATLLLWLHLPSVTKLRPPSLQLDHICCCHQPAATGLQPPW
jgi:hypothetical protein